MYKIHYLLISITLILTTGFFCCSDSDSGGGGTPSDSITVVDSPGITAITVNVEYFGSQPADGNFIGIEIYASSDTVSWSYYQEVQNSTKLSETFDGITTGSYYVLVWFESEEKGYYEIYSDASDFNEAAEITVVENTTVILDVNFDDDYEYQYSEDDTNTSLTGEWTGTFTEQDNDVREFYCSIVQEDDTLSGTAYYGLPYSFSGTFSGSDIIFDSYYLPRVNAPTYLLDAEGELAGISISGTFYDYYADEGGAFVLNRTSGEPVDLLSKKINIDGTKYSRTISSFAYYSCSYFLSESAGDYTVSLTDISAGIDLECIAYDYLGNLILDIDDHADNSDETGTETLTADTRYYIFVKNNNNVSGTYNVSVTGP
jgi:hypothetical protein